nr:putative Gag-Pol polyprotein [Tanacetum cinerariifolium]
MSTNVAASNLEAQAAETHAKGIKMSTNVAASNSKEHAAETQATGISKSSQPSSLLFLDQLDVDFDGSTTIRKTHASDVGFLIYPLQLVALDRIEPTNNKYMIHVTGYVTKVGHTTYLITDYQKGASNPHKPAEVENQLDRKIKVVRSDRGGGYYGRHTDDGQALGSFFDFCKVHGIINQYTMSGTPQQNGVAEKRNRTLMDMYQNCRDTSSEFFENANNSGSGSFRRIKLQESRDVTPIIHVPIPISTSLDTSNDHLIAQDHPNNVDENKPNLEINVEPQETQQPLHKSQRNRQPINFDDYYTYLNEVDFDLGKCNDPESFEDAITCDQPAHWREAMEDEMNSMSKNNFWELVELPKGAKLVGCKWVFKTKLDPNGNIERYKARLVAKGYTQKEGVDYKETLSPVSRKDSLRIVMALVAHFDLELHQMNVKTAFLNGDLHEDLYMVQPQASNNIDLVHESKRFLSINFDMKDLVEASYVIGIEIHRDRANGRLGLSQKAYIERILNRFNMQHCSPTVAPVIKGDVFGSHQCPKTKVEYEETKQISYAFLVGSLTYAQVCTRPNIAYICGMLGRFQSNPGLLH